MIDDESLIKVLSDDQEQLIQVMQSHATLQHQFEQLTKHVEHCYARIANAETHISSLEEMVRNKILS